MKPFLTLVREDFTLVLMISLIELVHTSRDKNSILLKSKL
jgi:hypothetical protein